MVFCIQTLPNKKMGLVKIITVHPKTKEIHHQGEGYGKIKIPFSYTGKSLKHGQCILKAVPLNLLLSPMALYSKV